MIKFLVENETERVDDIKIEARVRIFKSGSLFFQLKGRNSNLWSNILSIDTDGQAALGNEAARIHGLIVNEIGSLRQVYSHTHKQ